eukprot:CAMPEP_0181452614 /NCGR_PEP_ID=MMETSP1110-20121109/29298_1 /TAXON_ID=174948 /ORGANISM="Symbiodinium sp., Strain CCMP421" /LENGTH=690 /DNA_ID=CAMNT_0023576903 /DNA_START=80 /DNA_END=2152 /DNA_ORIENTATION=+
MPMLIPLISLAVALAAVGAATFQLVPVFTLILGVGLCCSIALGIAVGQRAVHFLGQDEQLVVEGFTGLHVQNGPGTLILNPFTHRSATIRKAESLSTTDYVKVLHTVEGSARIEKGPRLLFLAPYEQVVARSVGLSLGSTEYATVKDLLTGEMHVIKGPCLWFPGPHEEAQKGAAISLSQTEYLIVEDQLTGDKKTVRGPAVWFPEAFEKSGKKQTAIALRDDEFIKLKDLSSGKRWIQRGKTQVFLEPTWQVEGGVARAWALKAYEYIRLMDTVTGKVTSHRGEKTVFPGQDDELLDGQVMQAIDLKVHEYVKILDQSTGVIRVESGSNASTKQVFLGPHDKVLDNGKRKAVEVDGEHAVLVRDKSTGQARLVTEKQLFIPGPHENIEQVQDLIKLSDHEALIVRNKEGEFQYFYGSDEKRNGQPRAFFLEPYSEIVKLCWSKGRRRETRNLIIERFDCRAQFMSFEFNCRTSDNVELILEGTFFWEVVDLPAMVKSTGDTSGDLCNHARSQFIRHVAKVTLKEFMDSSHAIAKKVWEEDTGFYGSRGVKIHSLEVTRYQCADSRTEQILEQIIQETTNRMNRLSQAESENEVSLFRTQGQIEQERLNGDLLAIKHQHSEAEAEVVGRGEAKRVAAFIADLEAKVPKLEDRISLWQVLRKNEALSCISEGNASLYYTPSDVDLSIQTSK